MPQINNDFSSFSEACAASMEWVESPATGVWRKRVYMDGPAEDCRVTSLVRYDAGACFPEHAHPDGEEILVLRGVFSDQEGDFGTGWHLLNPSDSHHQSYSEKGCVILVKLRQYAGKGTIHQDINQLEWQRGNTEGVCFKPLYKGEERGILTRIVRFDKDTKFSNQKYSAAKEVYVMDGSFEDDYGMHVVGSWLRYPVNVENSIRCQGGCTLYVQTGGVDFS